MVAAAFGVFEPGFVAGVYDAARAAVPLDEVRALTEAGTVAALERVLGRPDGLTGAVATLRAGLDAADATAALTDRGLVADGTLTGRGSVLREEIEATTDAMMAPVVDAIGAALPDLVRTLDGWARRIVDAGCFPPDPYKRATG